MKKKFLILTLSLGLLAWYTTLNSINRKSNIGEYIIANAQSTSNDSYYHENISLNQQIKEAIDNNNLEDLNKLYDTFNTEEIKITNLKYLNLFNDLKTNNIYIPDNTQEEIEETEENTEESVEDDKNENYSIIDIFQNNNEYYGKMVQTNRDMEDKQVNNKSELQNSPLYLIEYNGKFTFSVPISITKLTSQLKTVSTNTDIYNLSQLRYVVGEDNKKYIIYDINNNTFVDLFDLAN